MVNVYSGEPLKICDIGYMLCVSLPLCSVRFPSLRDSFENNLKGNKKKEKRKEKSEEMKYVDVDKIHCGLVKSPVID